MSNWSAFGANTAHHAERDAYDLNRVMDFERDLMQDRDAIRQKLIELMESDTGETYGQIEDGANLRAELGLDSVDVVSIVSNVERHYRIRLSQQELETLVAFGDVLDLLESKLRDAGAKAA